MDIIKARRQKSESQSDDMIWNLMRRAYKNGTQIPDKEIAHMMITMPMADQHSSSAVSAWIMLRLATFPNVMENLFRSKSKYLVGAGDSHRFATRIWVNLCSTSMSSGKLFVFTLPSTLSCGRSFSFPGTNWVVPTSHTLLASPWVPSKSKEHLEDPEVWKPGRWNTKIASDDCDVVDYGYRTVSSGYKESLPQIWCWAPDASENSSRI